MYFWSKGLGKRSHLVIACGSEDVEFTEDKNHIKLLGYTRPPVEWNYEITMDEDDAVSVLELGLTRKFARYLVHPKRFINALSLLYWIMVFLFNFSRILLFGADQIKSEETEKTAT